MEEGRGWLIKSPPPLDGTVASLIKHKWRRRFFVLRVNNDRSTRSARLHYYRNEKCYTLGSKVIDLDRCDSLKCNLKHNIYSHIFSLDIVYLKSKRTYYLAANTEEVMNKWVELMTCELNKLQIMPPGPVPPTEDPPPPQDPPPSPVVIDTVPYNKLKIENSPVGRGRFGVVYRAFHKDWGCPVAYKKLDILRTTEKFVIEELKKEANIHRQLRHRNIVSMLGVVFEDQNYGLVLEYVCYGSLASFISHIRELSDASHTVPCILKTRMLSDVCAGMSYLHSLQPMPVIHGDLKLQNVVVEEQLNVKISDFGLSKWKDSVATYRYTDRSLIQGTPSHIAPEKWINPGLRRDEKFDVYSFAILALELFTESKAFENEEDICDIVSRGERPPSVDCLKDIGVPHLIICIIKHCWEQKPVKRPSFKDVLPKLQCRVTSDGDKAQIALVVQDVLAVYERHSDTNQTMSNHGLKMERVSQKLCSAIRRTGQILTLLAQKNALTSQEYEEIRSNSNVYNITKHLINVLSRKPVTAYQCFLDALTATKQEHLCQLLNGGMVNVDHQELLIQNITYLKSHMIVGATNLLDHLLECDVLDEQEIDDINSRQTEHGKVEETFWCIMRTSYEQYQKFLKALDKSGQKFIADELQKDFSIYVICNEPRSTIINGVNSVHR